MLNLDFHAFHNDLCLITTDRLALTIPQPQAAFAWNVAIRETFSELQKWLHWATHCPSFEGSVQFIESALQAWQNPFEAHTLYFFIQDKSTQRFLGSASLHSLDWDIPCGEIGYWLRKSAWGQGFMREAVEALTNYALEVFSLQRVQIRCEPQNYRSRQIPEKLDYQLEGCLKYSVINPGSGQISDTLIYARYPNHF